MGVEAVGVLGLWYGGGMKMSGKNNFAFIDGSNLHKGTQSCGISLDYKKFRSWLRFKYGVTQAFIFIGYIKSNQSLYTNLQNDGYELVFKDVVPQSDGTVKGNCDSDLVLRMVTTKDDYDKAILVSSDGDFASSVAYLRDLGKFLTIISPGAINECSILLKRLNVPIVYLNKLKRGSIS